MFINIWCGDINMACDNINISYDNISILCGEDDIWYDDIIIYVVVKLIQMYMM